jgi:hypothetical protein
LGMFIASTNTSCELWSLWRPYEPLSPSLYTHLGSVQEPVLVRMCVKKLPIFSKCSVFQPNTFAPKLACCGVNTLIARGILLF